MRKSKKAKLTLLFLMILLMIFGVTADAGFRRMSNGRYRYYVTANSYIRGKKAGKNRIAAFKNLNYKGKKYTYAFDENGYMLTGWQVLYNKDKKGASGLCCYYFNKNGQMLKNTSKSGYYFLGNGRLVNGYDKYCNYYGIDVVRTSETKSEAGFVKSKKGTKYQISKGNYATKTWLCIREKNSKKAYWYYFKNNGYMAKNTYVGTHYVDKHGRWIPSKDK